MYIHSVSHRDGYTLTDIWNEISPRTKTWGFGILISLVSVRGVDCSSLRFDCIRQKKNLMLFLSGTTKTWYGGTDVTGGLNRKLCRRTSVPTFSEVLYMQILHNHNYLLINCYVTKYTKALFAGVEQQHNTFNFAFVPQNKVTHSLHVYTST